MGYGIRDGDIIALSNEKAGALTLSQNLYEYRNAGAISPAELWEQQPAIRTVVDFITTTMASVGYHLYDRGDDDSRIRNYDHRVARALRRPGYKLGQKRWVQQLAFDRMIYDRWAFTIDYTEAGGLEFIRLPAERITLITDESGRFEALGIWVNGTLMERPLNDIVFDVGVGPTRGKRKPGNSPLTALTDLANELAGMSDYRANLFRNSAMVPAVIERPVDAPKWSDEAWGRFKTEFSTYRAGGGNAGGTPLLEDGMKLKPVDVFNPKDSQYIEVRQLSLIEAAQVCRIPPELVGAREGTNSNIISLREQLYKDVLGPEFGFFEDALNVGIEHLLQPNQYIEANLMERLRGSATEQAKIYQAAGGRPWRTLNEIRKLENLPSIPGGDEIITPMNVTEGGQANPQDSAPEDNGQEEKDGQLSADPKVRGLGSPRSIGTKSEADPYAEIDRLTTKMETQVVRWFHGYAERMAAMLGVDLEEPKARPRLKAVPDINREEMLEEAQALSNILLARTKELAEAGSELVLLQWNPDAENFDPARQLAWLQKASTQTALRFDAYVLDMFAEAMKEPATWTEGVRRTLTADGDIKNWMTGLATEAASFGETDAAKASGLNYKTWITTSSNPRASHKSQNGVTIGIDDVFTASYQRYPGDWWGGFAEVANCKCRLTFSK